MISTHTFAVLTFVCLFLIAGFCRAENIVFPEGAGISDITKAPYNAVGDGKTDCTAAIQQALIDAVSGGPKTIYFPNGTYLISNTLEWKGRATRNMFQGQSRDGAVLKLADACPGFTDPSKPKPMVVTGYFPPQRFRNAIRNMTFDAGSGNFGAIAVRFNASNQGQISDVTIRCGDRGGLIGLDMGYTGDVGPLLVKNLRVVGFEVGIYTAYATACQTLEHIELENQRAYGWVNDGQALAVRDLRSVNRVPALINKRGSSMMTILDTDLRGEGEASNLPAIINEAGLYVENLKTSGYKQAVDGTTGSGVSEAAASAERFLSHPAKSVFDSPAVPLAMQIEETPEVPWDDPATWVSVTNYLPKQVWVDKAGKVYEQQPDKGIKADKVYDWTDAIQQAVDAGGTTVYFPLRNPTGQQYAMLGTVHLRGKTRRIIGMETSISSAGHPTFMLEDGESPVVVIERFDWIYSNMQIRTNSKRTLAAKALIANVRVGPGGRVFLEDGVFAVRVDPGASLWMRQFNTEYTNEPRHSDLWTDMPWYEPVADPKKDLDKFIKVHPGNLNDGGRLWAMGLKSEGDGTLLTTINGGQSVVMGGLIYANQAKNPEKNAFVVKDSSLSFSVGEWAGRNQPFNMLKETRGDQSHRIERGALPMRGSGALVTLVNAYQDPAGPRAQLVGAKVDAPQPPANESNGAGLTIELFEGEFGALKKTAVAAPEVAQNEPAVAGLKKWSARFSGELRPAVSGVYRFGTPTPHCRLMIGDRLLIDAWRNEARYRDAGIYLEAGRSYPIKFEARSEAQQAVKLSINPPAGVIEGLLHPRSSPVTKLSIKASSPTVKESGSPAIITVERDGDLSNALTVPLMPENDFTLSLVMNYAARGNAVAGRDYKPLADQITIPAGAASATLAVEPIDNQRYDPKRAIIIEPALSADYDIDGGGRIWVDLVDDDAPPAGKGTGLTGRYFAGREAEKLLATRLDPQIAFQWDKTPPVDGIDMKKGFVARWEGQLLPQFTEAYQLSFDIADYAALRVWVDGKQVIDFKNPSTDPKHKLGERGTGIEYARVPMTAGTAVPIKIEYVGVNFYGQNITMKWSSPSQFLEAVPTSQLVPADAAGD